MWWRVGDKLIIIIRRITACISCSKCYVLCVTSMIIMTRFQYYVNYYTLDTIGRYQKNADKWKIGADLFADIL